MMMTGSRLGLLLLAWLASTVHDANADPTKVSGWVVLADGNPAVGFGVASMWDHSLGKIDAFQGLKTDAEGRFTLPVESHGRPFALMATDADGKLGGLILIKPEEADKPVEIEVGPLARIRGEFTSSDPAYPVETGGVYAQIGEQGPRIALSFTFAVAKEPVGKVMPKEEVERDRKPKGPARFELRLPPGEYHFLCYVPDELETHRGIMLPVTIKPDQAGKEVDLGKIELQLNPLAKLSGKEPPPLKIKDARGVPKDVKLADFKGKWVLLEFWATWSEPSIAQGLPDLVELYDEHEADRDKFVILAIHGKGSDDFADLDKKLEPIVRDKWQGRPLPFPILLDDDSQTFETFGVQSIPMSILIDPDGKIVGELGVEALGEVLPEIPLAKRLTRALDRQIQCEIGPKGASLNEILQILPDLSDVDIEIKPDADALARAGVKLDAHLPLTITGQISLRSWLDLILDPFELVAIPGPEGLIVTTPDPARPRDKTLSAPQRLCAERIGKKLEEKTRFDFARATLLEVASYFEEQTGENFVLDPSDRLLGRLDPGLLVTGKSEGVPLKDALKTLLKPIGIETVIRDEVVILTRVRP